MLFEKSELEKYVASGAKVWESAGGYAPTLGIIGAVMGLIQVMQNLTDPSKLGAGIAVAFVATIYGLFVANLWTIPFSTRIKVKYAEIFKAKEIINLYYLSGRPNNPRKNKSFRHLA